MKYRLLLVFLFCVEVISAQDYMNYLDLSVPLPPEVSVFERIELSDCTYIREVVDDADIYIYNECCRPRKDEPTYLNGEQVPDEVYWTKDGQFSVQPNAKQAQQMLSIVDEAFTMEQADLLKGYYMFIALRVLSITGELTDVYFHFVKTTPYEDIPMEVFRDIERRMKNELHFEITDFGKSLTYSSLGWAHSPKGRAEESTTETEDDAASGSGNNGSVQTDIGGVITDRGTVGGDVGGGISGRGNNPLTPTIGGRVTP